MGLKLQPWLMVKLVSLCCKLQSNFIYCDCFFLIHKSKYHYLGTGKTHTMEGDLASPENYGVIPRAAEHIFDKINDPSYISSAVLISCLEIYNEELRDLLTEDESPQKKLEIIEGGNDVGVICKGLIEKEVTSVADMLSVMKLAQNQRITGETNMNRKSSRSHCVFTINVSTEKKFSDGRVNETRGKLHLVDLAGSESAKTAAIGKADDASYRQRASYRERGRERSNINKSLLTLGRVIVMLNEQCNVKKRPSTPIRIPYRDSKLTRILQNSLGGHCKTIVIATVSPSVLSIDETMSTLNYAQSACGIKTNPFSQSFIKDDEEERCSTSVQDIDESDDVEKWIQMENKVKYLQAQLEEAQIVLERHFEREKELEDRADAAILRAEQAELNLKKTQHKLKESESNLDKSILVLQETKTLIDAQQDHIDLAKIDQEEIRNYFVQEVLQGINQTINEKSSIISTGQEKMLKILEQQNSIISRAIYETKLFNDSMFVERRDDCQMKHDGIVSTKDYSQQIMGFSNEELRDDVEESCGNRFRNKLGKRTEQRIKRSTMLKSTNDAKKLGKARVSRRRGYVSEE